MNKTEKNYLASIKLLGEQVKQSFTEASLVKLPRAYRTIDKIMAGGMGGSQLGVDLIKALFNKQLKLPIAQVRNYQLPGFVNNKTLVFLISYSGGTEEVLELGRQAKKVKAKVVAITSGGKLAQLAKKNHWPVYNFKPLNNPSGQPRLGTGYTIGSLLAVLKKLNKIQINKSIMDKFTAAGLVSFQKYISSAKVSSLAKKLFGKIPVIVSAEHLAGNAHIMANQIQESAKQTALYFNLPELNHHLLEGLTIPKSNRQNFYFLFFNSKDYYPKNQKRFSITAEVLKKQKIKFQQFEFSGQPVEQAAEVLVFGSLLSYELSNINKVDPNNIPWVNYFKRRLYG